MSKREKKNLNIMEQVLREKEEGESWRLSGRYIRRTRLIKVMVTSPNMEGEKMKQKGNIENGRK